MDGTGSCRYLFLPFTSINGDSLKWRSHMIQGLENGMSVTKKLITRLIIQRTIKQLNVSM
jgi:hypothetical protein